MVIHYTAAKKVGRDTAQYLRQIQSSYVRNRGYSIGYNAAVDLNGVTWELRGDSIRSAANVHVNSKAFAILVLVDGDDPANPSMIAAIRDLVAQVRQGTRNTVAIVGHKDVGSTACPGNGLYGQLINGTFEPVITSDIEVEDTDMKIINPPVRKYDSRSGSRWKQNEVRKIPVGDYKAVFVNITATQSMVDGFVTAWGAGVMPNVSNLNYQAYDCCNGSWVPVDNGHINVSASSPVHLIVDLQAGV